MYSENMKKLLLSLLALSLPILSYGVTYNVTVPSGTKACYIAGEMNSWSQQAMSKVDETHYTLNITSATTAHKYKYCSGPGWNYEELDALGNVISNRDYTANDIVIKWRAVYTPASNTDPLVKFTVDMSNQIIDGTFNPLTDKVYLRGTFNNWDLSNEMTKQSDGTYSISINLKKNTYYDFRFYTNAVNFPNSGWESNVGLGKDNRNFTQATNDLDIGKVYFNNSNLKLRYSGTYFNFYCAENDAKYVSDYVSYLNNNLSRIVQTLEATVGPKVNIYIFPERRSFMLFYGNPTGPDWVVGFANMLNSIAVISPDTRGGNLDEGLIGHEFTHIIVGWKTKTYVPIWMNEGIACYYPGEFGEQSFAIRKDGQIKTLIQNTFAGIMPSLNRLEGSDFADIGGYALSTSVADFVVNTHGPKKLADFIVNMDYSVLGYPSKSAFETAWHNFLTNNYLTQQINLKYQVDLSYYISQGWFNATTDKVYVGGDFLSWTPYRMNSTGNGIYYMNYPANINRDYQYKFKINTAGANNDGWETIAANRTTHTNQNEIILSAVAFNNLNPTLSIHTPNGGESLVAGDSVTIKWKYTTIPNVKIEYSADNENTWNVINQSVASDKLFIKWKIPNLVSSSVKIKISDVSNGSIYDLSDASFEIVQPKQFGPYASDNNTILLMHFENNVENSTGLSENGNLIGQSSSYNSDSPLQSGKSLKLSNNSYISISQSSVLNLDGDWTLEAWIKLNSFNSNDYTYFIKKPGNADPYFCNYALSLSPWWGNVFYGFFFSDTSTRIGLVSQTINLNEWYHIAMILDKQKKIIKILVHDKNRVLLSSYENPYTPTTTLLSNQNLIIGAGLDGDIDEVRISNKVRDFTTTGINNTKDKSLFSIYPNPTNGIIHLNMDNSITDGIVKITNLNGQEVYNKDLTNIINSAIDISHLNKGVYFIRIFNNENSWTKKIILQ